MLQNTQPPPHRLSFVSVSEREKCFWAPDRTGDYSLLVQRGKAYGSELIAYVESAQDPVIVGSVIKSMIQGGQYTGVEIGFCQAIGVHLAAVEMEPLRRATVG